MDRTNTATMSVRLRHGSLSALARKTGILRSRLEKMLEEDLIALSEETPTDLVAITDEERKAAHAALLASEESLRSIAETLGYKSQQSYQRLYVAFTTQRFHNRHSRALFEYLKQIQSTDTENTQL